MTEVEGPRDEEVPLAIETPFGRINIAKQQETMRRCARAWGLRAEAIEDPTSPIDARFYRGDALAFVAEIKHRFNSVAGILRLGSYMITNKKLAEARAVAQMMGAPLVLIVNFSRGNDIGWWRLTDRDGEWLVTFESKRTTTRETCNGGRIVRLNSFLSLAGMRILKR